MLPLAGGVACVSMEHLLEQPLILLARLPVPEDIGLRFLCHVVVEKNSIVSLVENVADVGCCYW